MSKNRLRRRPRSIGRAILFAALGDETRLMLIRKLSGGVPHSISRLTRGSVLTRQAVTKHLRILEKAGLVRAAKSGRESLFELTPGTLGNAQAYLESISSQWDDALGRLKTFVEK